jgi:hypothetical protein
VCLLTADEPTTLSDNPGSIILFSTLMMRAIFSKEADNRSALGAAGLI